MDLQVSQTLTDNLNHNKFNKHKNLRQSELFILFTKIFFNAVTGLNRRTRELTINLKSHK